MNITRTPWATTPSLPIPDTTYPKKEPMSPPRIRHYRLPHSPKHPGTDAGEDPHHQKPRKCTVEHAHKDLFPPHDEVEHDSPIEHRLIGTYRYDTCMHLCPYAPCRRCRGVGRGQPLTDPSPGTMSLICSPFPALVARSSLQIRPRVMFPFFSSSSPSNPVYARRVDFSDLVFSLSSHRHSYIYIWVCVTDFGRVTSWNGRYWKQCSYAFKSDIFFSPRFIPSYTINTFKRERRLFSRLHHRLYRTNFFVV